MSTSLLEAASNVPIEPPYLSYWENYPGGNSAAVRIGEVEKALAHSAIRTDFQLSPEDAQIMADIGEQAPPRQAEMWYRLLGPSNSLEGAEPDLVRAIQVMDSRSVAGKIESHNLTLDTAYALRELARISSNPNVRQRSIDYALQKIKAVESESSFLDMSYGYQVRAKILEFDLLQDKLRLAHAGTLEPTTMPVEAYRKYENYFAQNEVRSIQEFMRFVKSEKSEDSFGMTFEWYFNIARRYSSWSDEVIDRTVVRGATSREDGIGWETTGGVRFTPPKNQKHDIVISTYQAGGQPQLKRIQLKGYDYKEEVQSRVEREREYDESVVAVIDLKDVFPKNVIGMADAVNQMVKNVHKFRLQYLEQVLAQSDEA